MQIDNQIPNNNPNKIILAPDEELDFDAMEVDGYTPFIQMVLN